MRWAYGKRRYVPDCCPKCGQRKLEPGPDFSSLLKAMYAGWNAVLVKRDPVWKVPRWYGQCGRCSMVAFVWEDNTIWDRLKKRKELGT